MVPLAGWPASVTVIATLATVTEFVSSVAVVIAETGLTVS